MRHPLIRQGEGAQAAHQRLTQEQRELRRNLDRIQNGHLDSNRVSRATAGGDNRKLRGIPAIGRGVTGAIPGTTPHNVR